MHVKCVSSEMQILQSCYFYSMLCSKITILNLYIFILYIISRFHNEWNKNDSVLKSFHGCHGHGLIDNDRELTNFKMLIPSSIKVSSF